MICINVKNILKVIRENYKTVSATLLMVLLTCLIYIITSSNYNKKYELNIYNLNLKLHPKNSYTGNSFVTDTYPIFQDVLMVGDSYTHMISSHLGFDFTNYSCPGLKLEYLEPVFKAALKCKKKYVTIFIGPNDFHENTPPKEFHDRLSKYIDDIKAKMDATVIVPTYLHSIFSFKEETAKVAKYSIDMYNDEILKISKEKDKVYYLDLKDINTVDDYTSKYVSVNDGIIDEIHFNYDFSVKFINKLYEKLMEIKKEEIFLKR